MANATHASTTETHEQLEADAHSRTSPVIAGADKFLHPSDYDGGPLIQRGAS